MVDSDLINCILEGTKVSQEEAQCLEKTLESNPDDCQIRAKLIGYYYHHYYCCEQARFHRVDHIVWLIKHIPNFDYVATPFIYVHLVDRDAYAQIKSVWKEQLDLKPDNAKTIANMAAFISKHEPEEAIKLFELADKLAPDEGWLRSKLKQLRSDKELLIANLNKFASEPIEQYFAAGAAKCDGMP